MVPFIFIGSGKSYTAKMLRDLEVENGGDAPRIHSMDDYFMTEVEKVVTLLILLDVYIKLFWVILNYSFSFISCHLCVHW